MVYKAREKTERRSWPLLYATQTHTHTHTYTRLQRQLPEITAQPLAASDYTARWRLSHYRAANSVNVRRPFIEFGRTRLSVLCSITRQPRYRFSTRPVLLEPGRRD